MTRKTLLYVVALMVVVGLTFGFATTAFAATTTYTITATAGANGGICPTGAKTVNAGGSVVYTMQPAEGYQVATITVDATTVPKACWYTFLNVQANHTIDVSFKLNPAGWYTVTPYAGEHGQIWMAQQTVQASDTAPAIVACSITADAGYHVETLVVDGMPVAPTNYYIFYNVRAGHTIAATFALDEVVEPDTLAPVSSSNAVANYLDKADVRLTSADEDGGSGMAALYYKVDGGPVVTITSSAARAAVGTPDLGIPAGHAGGAAPASCACHPNGSIPPTHSAGAAPATCACHVVESPSAPVDMPSTHAGRTGGCKSCHPAAGVIMPTSATNPNHYGQSVGFYGGGDCESCHTFNVLPAPVPSGALATTVTVTGTGAHTIEFWGADVAGNTEAPHKTVNFTVAASGPLPTTITIRTNATSVARGKTFILSGVVTPASMVGTNVQVMVKYPTKSFYSYSSLRTCYMNGAVPSWWYRYAPLKTQPAGVYKFYAFVPASATYAYSQSPTLNVSFK